MSPLPLDYHEKITADCHRPTVNRSQGTTVLIQFHTQVLPMESRYPLDFLSNYVLHFSWCSPFTFILRLVTTMQRTGRQQSDCITLRRIWGNPKHMVFSSAAVTPRYTVQEILHSEYSGNRVLSRCD